MLETDLQTRKKLESRIDFLVSVGGIPVAYRIALRLDCLANDSDGIAEELVDLNLIAAKLKGRLKAVLAKQPDEMEEFATFLDGLVNRPTGKIPSHKPGRRSRGRR
jgi:hypothetical protein